MTIDKNIPLPPIRRKNKYPWGNMNVGDSVFVPGKEVRILRPTYSTWGSRHGKRFVGQNLEENGVKGIRVWRIE